MNFNWLYLHTYSRAAISKLVTIEITDRGSVCKRTKNLF